MKNGQDLAEKIDKNGISTLKISLFYTLYMFIVQCQNTVALLRVKLLDPACFEELIFLSTSLIHSFSLCLSPFETKTFIHAITLQVGGDQMDEKRLQK